MEKSRTLNLRAVVKDADLDITGVRIIPVDNDIPDVFAQRFQWIIPPFRERGFVIASPPDRAHYLLDAAPPGIKHLY